MMRKLWWLLDTHAPGLLRLLGPRFDRLCGIVFVEDTDDEY